MYSYLRERNKKDGSAHPKAAVAIKVDDKGVGQMGFSMVDPLDKFSKKLAREIAQQRLARAGSFNVQNPEQVLSAIENLPIKMHSTAVSLMFRAIHRYNKRASIVSTN